MVDHFLNSSHAPPTPEMSLQTEFPFLAGHPWPQQDLNHPPREITEPGTPATPPQARCTWEEEQWRAEPSLVASLPVPRFVG